MKRLGALAAAVLLVLGAVWVRDRLGDGGVKLGGGDPTGTVVCSTELARACETLREEHPGIGIKVEAAGATSQALAGGSPQDFDVWLVSQPYAAVAAESLRASGGSSPLGPPSEPIAHSRLAFFVHASRAAAFNAHCGDRPGWGCLLSAVSAASWQDIGGQAAWGTVKPYVADPLESTGLLSLGGAAAGVLEPPIDGPAIRDNLQFAGALDSLKRSRVLAGVPASGALQRMLAAGPSVADLVVALAAEGARFGASVASKATLLYPAPVVSAEIVAVPRRGSAQAEELIDLLSGEDGRAAFTSAGWAAGAAPAAQKSSPSVGSHIVLRQTWEEIR